MLFSIQVALLVSSASSLLQPPQNVRVIKFIEEVFQSVLPKGFPNVVYLSDHDEIGAYVGQALAGSYPQMQTHQIGTVVGKNLVTKYAAYVVVAGNMEILNGLFEHDRFFTKESPILVFMPGFGDFQRHPYTYLTNMRNINLITIEGLKGTLVKVTLVENNRTLIEWDKTTTIRIDPGIFTKGEWVPNFWYDDKHHELLIQYSHCPLFSLEDDIQNNLGARFVQDFFGDWPKTFVNDYYDENSTITDIRICPESFKYANYGDDIDWVSTPVFQYYTSFLVPKPQLLPEVTFVLQPFRLNLWLVILGNVVTLLVFVKIFERANTKMDVVCSNSTTCNAPAKIVVTSWSVLCLLLSSAYSGGFTTSLTLPRYQNPINTLGDLLESNLNWVIREDSSFYNYMLDVNDSMATKITGMAVPIPHNISLHTIEPNTFAVNIFCYYSQPCSGYTYFGFLGGLGQSQMKQLEDYYEFFHLFFFLSANSPHARRLNRITSRIVEHGILNFWYKKYEFDSLMMAPQLVAQGISNFRKGKAGSLNLKKLQGAFFLLILGNILSSVVFICEVLWKGGK